MSFLNKKITFRKERESQILVFENKSLKLKFRKLEYRSYPSDKINLRYFVKAFFHFIFKSKNKSLKDLYFYFLISDINPKVAIGEDRDLSIFKFIRLFPNLKSICYEGGYTFDHQIPITLFMLKGNVLFKNKKLNENLRVNRDSTDFYLAKDSCVEKKVFSPDIFLVYDKRSEEIYKTVHTSNFHIVGSIKNNLQKSFKKNYTYDFMFISQFRNLNNSDILKNRSEMFNNSSLEAAQFLHEFCKKNHKNYIISLSSLRKDKNNSISFEQEKSLYERVIGKFNYLNKNSYECASTCKVIVCTYSNLGYELLARKKKVVFINNLKNYKWHFSNSKISKFNYFGNNKEKVHLLFNEILNLSELEWEKTLESDDTLMKYDPSNGILNNITRKLLLL